MPVRRLTAPQLVATVQDVLGQKLTYPIADETLLGYRSNTSSAFDTTSARLLLTTAEQAVDAAMPGLLGDPKCVADCAAFLLDDVARRLFRRPLDIDARARFAALYDRGVAAEGAEGGARWLLTGLLQSPRFVYMLESSDAKGRLDGYAVASRLSYALWGGPPDAALLEAAQDDRLGDAAAVAAMADRMIDDPRFLRGLREFAGQWLGLEQLDDSAVRPDIAALGDAAREALAREPVDLLAAHIRTNATLAELLTATETQAEPALQSIYGKDILGTTGEVARFDTTRRIGLLALPGVLAARSHAEQTSPTLRGRAVLANLLCRPTPPPPANVNPTLPPTMQGVSTRQRLEAHFSSPTCAGCHASMDGIGFAFEGFDWLGRSRTLDNGHAIDSHSVFALGQDTVTVNGAPDLARALAEQREVAECFARHFNRYATGVNETDDFTCALPPLVDALKGEQGLRGMLLAYVTLPWFVQAGTPVGDMP